MSDQNDEPTEDGGYAYTAKQAEKQPEPEPEPEPEKPASVARSPYLDRAKMLPVEGIVYCLEHTAVHDDTTDPYNYGKPDCDKKEHRPVYYRGRKGDVDESLDDVAVMHGEEGRGTSMYADIPEGTNVLDDLSGEQDKIKKRIIAKSNAEELTDPEREIVMLLVAHAAKRTEDAATLMHEVWPDDDLVGIRIKLTLLDSVSYKIGGKV